VQSPRTSLTLGIPFPSGKEKNIELLECDIEYFIENLKTQINNKYIALTNEEIATIINTLESLYDR